MRRVHVLANKVGVMGRGWVRAGTESAWCMPPPWRRRVRRVVAIAIGAAVALVAPLPAAPDAHKASFDLLGVVGDTAALSGAAHGAVEGAVNMPEHAGPQVVDGMFVRDGLPYRGIGVNYFDAFYRSVKDPQDTSYEAGFSALAAHGIRRHQIPQGTSTNGVGHQLDARRGVDDNRSHSSSVARVSVSVSAARTPGSTGSPAWR
jgi:hypothetical protein